MKTLLFFCLLLISNPIVHAQWKPFRFAFLSDTHIGSPNGAAEEDLRRTVADINQMTDIAFVIITGDITELGTDEQLKTAHTILSHLKVPYYIIPGNHDSGWSESGGTRFAAIFGYETFHFTFNGIHFLGCPSGPYVRMSDGHIPRNAVVWLDQELKKIPPEQPLVFLNHYPLTKDLDNWYEAIDRLKQHNTLAVLCGHGHSNHRLDFEGIPAVMGRSNLRAKAAYGGYNLVDVKADSMVFSERTPGISTKESWTGIPLFAHQYDLTQKYPRPDYSVNDSFPQVRAKWTFASPANVISTPAVARGLVLFGNSLGEVTALSLGSGKKQWRFQTGNAIYSSPAISDNRMVLGSTDGYVYCLSVDKGQKLWQFKTGAAVLGSPLIVQDTVYIGGSDHRYRALDLKSGKEIWQFTGLDGPVMSTPFLLEHKLVFGAWDCFLYALDNRTGKLVWKWDNGSPIRNYSPAACIPVIENGIVYVVAPDRYLSAIDLQTGKTLWRSNAATVRESLGVSEDGKYLYGKTMNDTIVAFPASATLPEIAWKLDAGFGYEHVPSMLIEKAGQVYFGTRSGRVYAIDPVKRKISWIRKIDNSMVNTVRVLNAHQLVAATMDGKITLLESK
ncbi:MAG: PQQ-binding-like beta-propeller repeat protein [Bacteroidota bacterium]|nr:PQQ-binding-like beta-propeller repeat protein [Bacteroidota bacterium]